MASLYYDQRSQRFSVTLRPTLIERLWAQLLERLPRRLRPAAQIGFAGIGWFLLGESCLSILERTFIGDIARAAVVSSPDWLGSLWRSIGAVLTFLIEIWRSILAAPLALLRDLINLSLPPVLIEIVIVVLFGLRGFERFGAAMKARSEAKQFTAVANDYFGPYTLDDTVDEYIEEIERVEDLIQQEPLLDKYWGLEPIQTFIWTAFDVGGGRKGAALFKRAVIEPMQRSIRSILVPNAVYAGVVATVLLVWLIDFLVRWLSIH